MAACCMDTLCPDVHVEPVYSSTLVNAPNVLWKLSVNHIGLAINRLRILV